MTTERGKAPEGTFRSERMARPFLILASALATTLLAAQGTQAARAADFDCEGFLRMHGLVRTAMRECGFAAYNPSIVDRARTCFEAVGDGKVPGRCAGGRRSSNAGGPPVPKTPSARA